jgi:HEAT repeat protein
LAEVSGRLEPDLRGRLVERATPLLDSGVETLDELHERLRVEPDPERLGELIWLAGWLGDPTVSGEPLRLLALEAADVATRLTALNALVSLRAANAPAVLREALRRDVHVAVRERAAMGLGEIEDGTAVDVLVALLEDAGAPTPVRSAAAEGLGLIGDPAALDPLRRAASDRAPDVADDARQSIELIRGR